MGELSLEHSKSDKLYIDKFFLSKVYKISARKFQRNYVPVTLKGDAKFKEKLTCGLRNNRRNLVNFHASRQNSWNLHFDGLFLTKAYRVSAKKVQKSYFSWHWRMMESLKKNWLFGSKNDMRNLVNFHPTTQKVQKFHFDWLFLSKVYEVWAKKIQRCYISWHWTVMQNFNKLWPCGYSKMAWGISWTFIRSLKVWKIVHWLALFVKSI